MMIYSVHHAAVKQQCKLECERDMWDERDRNGSQEDND